MIGKMLLWFQECIKRWANPRRIPLILELLSEPTRKGKPPHLNKQYSYILILVVLVLLLEFSRLKTLWISLTKGKASAKSSKACTLKPKSEKDCPYCQTGHAQIVPSPETSHTPYSQTPTALSLGIIAYGYLYPYTRYMPRWKNYHTALKKNNMPFKIEKIEGPK